MQKYESWKIYSKKITGKIWVSGKPKPVLNKDSKMIMADKFEVTDSFYETLYDLALRNQFKVPYDIKGIDGKRYTLKLELVEVEDK